MARRRITSAGSWLSPLLLAAACGGDDGGGAAGSATDAPSMGTSGEPDGSSGVSDTGAQTTGGDQTPDPIDCGEMTRCGQVCADLQTDPANCGECGISCVIANAEAVCEAGECAMGACAPGFSDCDGNLANGCEAAVECTEGGPCETRCGSTGTVSCGSSCEAECMVPAEACNAIDDDCNGECDEGPIAGCRVGVHRANSPTLGHFYTVDLNEAQSGDFNLESQDYFFVYGMSVEGLTPLHRCLRSNGKRFYTNHNSCEDGGVLESTLGFMAPDERCGAVPLYRLYHAGNDAYFYTVSAAERDNAVDNLGWTFEFIAGYVWSVL